MNFNLSQFKIRYFISILVLGLWSCQPQSQSSNSGNTNQINSISPQGLECPETPSGSLTAPEVIDISRQKFQKQDTIKYGESIGLVFSGKQGQVIDLSYDDKKLCVWLYAPNNSLLVKSELPVDGNYIIQIESLKPVTQYEIELSNIKTEVLKIVDGYLKAKPQIFGPPFDSSLVARFTTDELYKANIGSIGWLTQNDAYYTYQLTRIDDIRNFSASSTTANIDLTITQDLTYHDNKGEKMQYVQRNYRYTFKKVGGSWKISDRQQLESEP